MDIAKNIKIIEGLKCELLCDLGQLYSAMEQNDEESAKDREDTLANMIMIIYILAKRLGVPYHALDIKILNKLKVGIIQNKDNEWYAEIASLSKHLEKSRMMD